MHKIKWFIPMMAAMLFVAVVVPGTSEAGKKWSGADPILTVNGEQVNIRVEWPSEFDCDILFDVQLLVMAPRDSAVNFESESFANFGGCEIETNTNVLRILPNNRLKVKTLLLSTEEFEVKTKVDIDGMWVDEFIGESNDLFSGNVDLDNYTGSVDPALPANYNGEAYTYDDDIYIQ